MAQKTGFNKLLEFIGVVDGEDVEQSARPETYRADTNRPPQARQQRARQEYARARVNTAGRPIPSDRAYSPRAEAPRRDREGALRRTGRELRVSQSTVITYVYSLEECSGVIEDLIQNRSVLLNLEEMDAATMQRVVDTLAGAAFALKAKMRKASEKIYLIAPESVEVNLTRQYVRNY